VATTAGVTKGSFRALVRLLRPKQWIKNAFVLAPLIFSGEFRDPHAVVKALLATALFCVASSATYIFNDILDREADSRHPIKSRTRPIASGEVSVNTAILLFGFLISIVVVSVAWTPATTVVVGTYTALNLAYTVKLKHVPVVDIFVLAAGFVLRVLAGAVVLDVPLSSWMMVTTLSLALYLAAVKRRDELTSSGGTARAVLNSYTVPLLDRYAQMAALCAVIFYGLFVVTVKPKLNVTLPIVLFGLFRYWYVVDNGGQGESPTDAVWSDWSLILTVIAWAAVCIWRLKALP
jgi:decaprenyl-phosphate phosphoribosyltransferase